MTVQGGSGGGGCPVQAPAAGSDPASDGGGATDQAPDQANQQSRQHGHVAAGHGGVAWRGGLGGDGADGRSGCQVALHRPGQLDGDLGALGLGGLQVAQQPQQRYRGRDGQISSKEIYSAFS
jgi:hypothetical protein